MLCCVSLAAHTLVIRFSLNGAANATVSVVADVAHTIYPSLTPPPPPCGALPTLRELIQTRNLLLRGCVLRNTRWVVGLVLNTGPDTKIIMSSLEVG